MSEYSEKDRYRVEVIADSSGKWCGNQVRFDTAEAARAYGKDLAWRWTSVRQWRVIETTGHVVEVHES